MNPASTSPEPIVASSGPPLVTAHRVRPMTKVGLPLSRTVAPVLSARPAAAEVGRLFPRDPSELGGVGRDDHGRLPCTKCTRTVERVQSVGVDQHFAGPAQHELGHEVSDVEPKTGSDHHDVEAASRAQHLVDVVRPEARPAPMPRVMIPGAWVA